MNTIIDARMDEIVKANLEAQVKAKATAEKLAPELFQDVIDGKLSILDVVKAVAEIAAANAINEFLKELKK